MAEQLPATYYKTPYKFTGKELDAETGMYYYGARYYDPKVSIWLSVDQLKAKYPNVNPYVYCLQNPINAIDPDGKDVKVTTNDGTTLFILDDGKKAITTMTVRQLYDKGTQWFEPLADNYMPLKSQTRDLSYTDKVKHFIAEEVLEFANEDRWMTSYVQGGSGDWKKSEDGADGYLLVTVDDKPYWADAIGQIPFAVDYVTDLKENGTSNYNAIRATIQKGKEYGDGEIIGGEADNSNRYDNYFILRGAANGANGRNITKPVTEAEARAYGL